MSAGGWNSQSGGIEMKRGQIRDLALFSVVLLVVGVLMRIFYPQPFVYSDSYTYIYTAAHNTFDFFRPNGYPRYLRLIHWLSPGLGFLFLVNYLFFALSSLLLLFSARQVLSIRNSRLFLVIGFCAILSPRLVFSTNYMMSDGVFSSLAAVFVASCLWLVKRPSWGWSIVNLLTLWLMCRLRYGGLFFIPASAVAFFLSLRGKARFVPVLVACAPILLGVAFYVITRYEYKKRTDVAVFSGFGGWQKINNALVLFPEAKELPPEAFKPEVRTLHAFMLRQPDEKFDRENTMGTLHMWSNELPCKAYVFNMCAELGSPYGYEWVVQSKVFGEYAKELVAKYPFRYLARYFLPSLWSTFRFMPFVEESIPVEEKGMLRSYYGVNYKTYHHRYRFFSGTVDPVRRVLNVVYWIAAVLSMGFFFYALKKKYYSRTAALGLLVLALMFIFVIGGQAVSSPCTTWRYTMPFYQASVVFILVNLREMALRLFRKKAGA